MTTRHLLTVFALFCVTALVVGCDRQTLGGACNSLVPSDCESPLVCTPLQGHTNLGVCCMPNSQCGTSTTGLMLSQDAMSAAPPPEASTDAQETGAPDSGPDGPESGARDTGADALDAGEAGDGALDASDGSG